MLNMKPITYDLFLNLLTIPLALLTIFSMQLRQWNIPQHEHRIPWQEGTSFLKESNLELSDSKVFLSMVDSSQDAHLGVIMIQYPDVQFGECKCTRNSLTYTTEVMSC
jgi:hypothetical protein